MNRPVLLAIALAGLSFCVGCQQSAPPARPAVETGALVTVAPVVETPMDRQLPVLGTLFAKDEATLSAEVEGKIEKTFVEFGDRVKAGQILAQIDTSTYDTQTRQAEATVARAQATSANAHTSLKRIQALTKDQVAAASELDQALAVHEQGQAELKSAQAGAALAKLNLEKSHVKAPFDAAVAERIVSAGDYVKIGSPLFRVVNDNVLKFIVQASERYASMIKKEQLITFSVDAWPGERFSGKVFLISPAINTSTRSFSLGALVDNSAGRLKANSFARGELIVETDVPVLMAPLDAILQASGNTRVFVVESGVARARVVEPGRVRKGLQEILSGLKKGELVVVTGHSRLIDGTPVRIRNDAPSSEGKRP
ncbi:MAG: efflux RND transporter periplasmic adaptor subunit [Verrucomicrobia bacterium]|nr:efflux RND transporter periplasmic adaptor subunit [Verrucomicrobiota bacterium]MBI3871056.1 efflux RND transporter periplasmic adaptor subunit [Verrucomicrobiota bacterium]